jgi:hypothetical protein
MNPYEFITRVARIKEYLFSNVKNQNFDKNFLRLLKYLKIKNILPLDLIADINIIWELRNKITSSPDYKGDIDKSIINLLAKIEDRLKLQA